MTGLGRIVSFFLIDFSSFLRTCKSRVKSTKTQIPPGPVKLWFRCTPKSLLRNRLLRNLDPQISPKHYTNHTQPYNNKCNHKTSQALAPKCVCLNILLLLLRVLLLLPLLVLLLLLLLLQLLLLYILLLVYVLLPSILSRTAQLGLNVCAKTWSPP